MGPGGKLFEGADLTQGVAKSITQLFEGLAKAQANEVEASKLRKPKAEDTASEAEQPTGNNQTPGASSKSPPQQLAPSGEQKNKTRSKSNGAERTESDGTEASTWESTATGKTKDDRQQLPSTGQDKGRRSRRRRRRRGTSTGRQQRQEQVAEEDEQHSEVASTKKVSVCSNFMFLTVKLTRMLWKARKVGNKRLR